MFSWLRKKLLGKGKQTKVEVERRLGNLAVFKVYLNPDELPFVFLEPADTDEQELIKMAKQQKALMDKFGLM